MRVDEKSLVHVGEKKRSENERGFGECSSSRQQQRQEKKSQKREI